MVKQIKRSRTVKDTGKKAAAYVRPCLFAIAALAIVYNALLNQPSLPLIYSDVSNSNVNDFALAKKESLGFFDDVTSAHWELLKQKVSDMSPNYSTQLLPHTDPVTGEERGDLSKRTPGFFYQSHYENDFVCQHERRIGNLGDGGKWICDPHRIAKQPSCLVYSVGSENDFSFEQSVHKDISPNCEIHTFDFGDYARGAELAGGNIQYHRVGVGIDAPPKHKSILTLVKELGHENRVIDIFKIDCEGCEWKTAKHWFDIEADASINVTLRQIQVELHGSDIQTTPQFFDLMYEHDYVITHKEPNIAYPQGNAIEYSFLKLAPEFSKDIVRAKGAAVQGE